MPIDENGKEFFPGGYRGTVQSVLDPEERLRVRVRIHLIHENTIPDEHLPWCEAFTDEDRPLNVGDRVAIIFEGGDRNHPFIMGRWFAVPAGLNDVKAERVSDYEQNRSRRMIYDGVDNLIELNAKRRYVRVKSGNNEVRLVQAGDSIEILALGPVTVRSNRANIETKEFNVDAGTVKISGTGRTPEPDPSSAIPATGVPTSTVRHYSNRLMEVYAGGIAGLDAAAIMDIGQIVDGSAIARQTGLVRLRPSVLQLGEQTPAAPNIGTLTVNIEGSTAVNVRSNGTVNVNGATLLKLESATKVEIESNVIEAKAAAAPVDSVALYTALKTYVDAHSHTIVGGSSAGQTTTPTLPGNIPDPLPTTVRSINFKAS
jgi:hypothetical protein